MVDRWLVEVDLDDTWDFYSRANFGEVIPDVVTPFWSWLIEWHGKPGPFENGFRRGGIRFGTYDPAEFPPDRPIFVAVSGGYAYLNVTTGRIFGHRMPGMTPDQIDTAYFGDAPGLPEFEVQEGDDRPDLSEKMAASFGAALTATEFPEALADEEMVNQLRAERPDLATLSDRELLDRALKVLDDHFENLFAQHMWSTTCVSAPVGVLGAVCAAVGRPEDTFNLMAGLGDVASAAPSMAMWELGRMAAESPELGEAFDAGPVGLAGRLSALAGNPDADLFLGAFEQFIYDYGSRGPNEWDPRCPTWETDPDLALAAIDRMRVADDDRSPIDRNEERAATRRRLAAEIGAMVEDDPEAAGQFAAALGSASVWMPGRERTKTNIVKMINEARVALYELGRRRVEEGDWQRVNDFALLFRDELVEEVDKPGTHSGVLEEREALRLEVAALQEPFFIVGEHVDMSTMPRRDALVVDALVAGDSLTGVGGCPGVARGTARVLLDSHDPAALEPGDILVAPITDPSWTPLFVPAEGVVVDVGAPLSHAVIVSRELGIPCVVSAIDATKKIPDGALVEVDGTTGVVTVLEAP